MNFVAPSEHQVLVFLVQLTVLLVVARLLGQACRRIGQPAVVGELAAGVLIGPSVLGRVWPDGFGWLFPADDVQSGMLFTVGWLGVMLLLVITGFDTDLALIARRGSAVVWVGLGSLLLPFALGIGGGVLAPAELRGPAVDRPVFALFLATALTISSLPVIARILDDLGLLRRDVGQLTIAVGMMNDVIGWVLLGLIAGLVASGGLDIAGLVGTVIGLVLFLLLAAAIGQRVVDRVLSALRRRSVGIGGWVTMSVAMALGLGAVTQALGVEAVLGAFVGGILLGRSRYARRDVEEQIETVTASVLAPIFFATAGLRVDLGLLADPTVALWAVIVVALASTSKFLGAWAGARIAGLGDRAGWALGAGLNARGALEIVIATVGLSIGALNDSSYAIVVVMAIATSVAAPPILRALVRDWPGTDGEQARLRREEQLAQNLIVRAGHLLMPVGEDGVSHPVVSVVGHAFPGEMSVTLLETGTVPLDDEAARRCVAALGERQVERRRSTGDVAEAVAEQLRLGFDLVVDAVPVAADWPGADAVARAVLSQREVPVLLLRPTATQVAGGATPSTFRRVLLPVSATRPSRAAAEIGVAFAASSKAVVKVLHVNPTEAATPVQRVFRSTFRSHERLVGSYADPVGVRLIDAVVTAADAAGVRCDRIFSEHQSRAEAILDAATANWCDLILLGVEAQEVDGEAFLGRTARRIMQQAPMAVGIIVLPPR